MDEDLREVIDEEPRQHADALAPHREWARSHIVAVMLLGLAAISILVLARIYSDTGLLNGVQDALDGQQATVSGLAAAATALSAALSLVPDGALEPVADQLADVSGWFVVIIAAIVLQKILVTIAGPAAFMVILPLACVLGIVYVYSRRGAFRSLALRFAALGIVLSLAVPASVYASTVLTDSYSDLTTASAEAEAEAEALAKEAAEAKTAEKQADDGDDSVLDSIGDWLSGAANTVGDAVGAAWNSLNDIKDDAVASLNSFMEKFALLIVTTCVMPIAVMLFLAWVIKMLFSVDLGVGRIGHTVQRSVSRGVGRGRRRMARSVTRNRGGSTGT